MTAPQANMAIARTRGTSVQPTSSARLPSTALPTSPSLFRLNLIAAKITSSVTNTEKNRQVSRMNENNESTLPAKLDASTGKNGSDDGTALLCSFCRQTRV